MGRTSTDDRRCMRRAEPPCACSHPSAMPKAKRIRAQVALSAAFVCASLLCGCAQRSVPPGEAFDTTPPGSLQLTEAIQERLDEIEALEAAQLTSRRGVEAGENSSLAAESQMIEPLQEQLEAYAAQAPMQVCAYVTDLSDGAVAFCNDEVALPSASMIKLLVAYTFLEQVHEGTRSLDDPYTLQYDDLVGGSGLLIGYGAGVTITYREALMHMIDVSDNVGANILIDAVGMDTVNDAAMELGLAETQLNRRMMDTDALAAGIDNYTCARDLALLMQMVATDSFVDEASSELMRQALEQQQDDGGIISGLPAGSLFAHKTGALSTVLHDGGIVEGEHPYVLVVLCGGDGFCPGGALQAMADIARMTDDAMASRG